MVDPSVVSELCKTRFRDAVAGNRIDAKHPCVLAYKKRKSPVNPDYYAAVELCERTKCYDPGVISRELHIEPGQAGAIIDMMRLEGRIEEPAPPDEERYIGVRAKIESEKRAASDKTFIPMPDNIADYADMPLRELIAKFGTDVRFIDWLNALQKIEAINEKRLKNEAVSGKLVSRELVHAAIIDPFNAAHLKMLKDGAKSIAAGVVAKHEGGATISELEAYVCDIVGSFIRPVKAKVVRALKNA